MNQSKLARAALSLAVAGITCHGSHTAAIAATVSSSHWTQLSADAARRGTTPVVIHLQPVSFKDMADPNLKAKMTAKANTVAAELGNYAWVPGRWENGAGQLGLTVTAEGLQILRASGNAISFYPDSTWQHRSALANFDGRLSAIEELLLNQGYADVQVTLNLDGLGYDMLADGSVRYVTTAQATQVALQASRALFSQLSPAQAPNKEAAAAAFEAALTRPGTPFKPEFTLRITREGAQKLASSAYVRGLQPVGFTDKRPVGFDQDALADAEKFGVAQVIISIRSAMYAGNLSAASFAAMVQSNQRALQSNQRALQSVLISAGVKSQLKDMSIFGVMSGTVTLADLRALRALTDARLLSVGKNRPSVSPSLSTSTASANFAPAWAAGYRGAGQAIIVMDTGVQRNHQFLTNAAGVSRVVYEACFGTNSPDGQFVSICPNQDALGDSPPGLTDSAAPQAGCAASLSDPLRSAPFQCNHGTHVAGIAAGRNSSSFAPGLQGVANEANIIAVQIFSFKPPGQGNGLSGFDADLLAGLKTVESAMQPGSTANPFTVNLSLGLFSNFPAHCGAPITPTTPNSDSFTTAVKTLFDLGIPVVAATGNDSSRTGIHFPACLPRVIKVGALMNDSAGTNIGPNSNLADPANFPGDFFWLAPGGNFDLPQSSTVRSSIPGGPLNGSGFTQATGERYGTSMAAPHVSGLYALVKAGIPGITVDGASQWIQNNASQNITLLPTNTYYGSGLLPASAMFKRIRLPNF